MYWYQEKIDVCHSWDLKPNSSYHTACLQTSSGFFCSINHLSGGGVNANHNAMHSPSLAFKNVIENDPKLLKISEGNRNNGWNFCWGQEADIALFLQETRIRKIIKSSKKTSRSLPETRRSQAVNLETKKQTKWIEMHQSEVNMCFLRGPLRWLTEQRNPKFLWSLQNAQHNTTNLAIKG